MANRPDQRVPVKAASDAVECDSLAKFSERAALKRNLTACPGQGRPTAAGWVELQIHGENRFSERYLQNGSTLRTGLRLSRWAGSGDDKNALRISAALGAELMDIAREDCFLEPLVPGPNLDSCPQAHVRGVGDLKAPCGGRAVEKHDLSMWRLIKSGRCLHGGHLVGHGHWRAIQEDGIGDVGASA